MTVTFTIPPDVEAQLLADAHANGVSLPDYLREVILDHYQEDIEDSHVAEARLSDPQTPISIHQLRRNLGLDR